MTETLRWPEGRGTFNDRDTDRLAVLDIRGAVRVSGGETIEVGDEAVAEYYLERGFERVTEAEAEPDVA